MASLAENLAQARAYSRAIENGEEFDELRKFFGADVMLETLPNRLVPRGSRDDLAGMRAASERGKKVMASQKYEVTNELASGDQVALEVNWTGTLAVSYETIPKGGQMHARFAMFLQFRDGKIVSQRNYDCFDPW
jgi:ketosteroid isomerase-like protein